MLNSANECRTRYLFLAHTPSIGRMLILSSFILSFMLILSSNIVPLRAQTGDWSDIDWSFEGDISDPAGPRQGIGIYLNNVEKHRYIRQNLRRQLDDCGECSRRKSLQDEYDREIMLDQNRLKGEKIFMKKMRLPFEDLADMTRWLVYHDYRMTSRQLEAQNIYSTRLGRVSAYSCIIKYPNDSKKADDCRAQNVANDLELRSQARNAPEVCYRKIVQQTRQDPHMFPPPDADPKIWSKHLSIWGQFEDCLHETNPFLRMNDELNHRCLYSDISSEIDRSKFLCLCAAIPDTLRSECKASMTNYNIEEIKPVALPTIYVDSPAKQMLTTQGFGPSILGVRMGMSLKQAEEIVRQKMEVAAVYEWPDARGSVWTYNQGRRQLINKLSMRSRMFINADSSEYIILLEGFANFPGRVFSITYGKFVEIGSDDPVEKLLKTENGPWDARLSEGLAWSYYWGLDYSQLRTSARPPSPCVPDHWGVSFSGWRKLSGGANLKGRFVGDTNLSQIELMQPIPTTSKAGLDYETNKCKPLLTLYSENSTSASILTKSRKEGQSKIVYNRAQIEDPLLVKWYELQQMYASGETKDAPVIIER